MAQIENEHLTPLALAWVTLLVASALILAGVNYLADH